MKRLAAASKRVPESADVGPQPERRRAAAECFLALDQLRPGSASFHIVRWFVSGFCSFSLVPVAALELAFLPDCGLASGQLLRLADVAGCRTTQNFTEPSTFLLFCLVNTGSILGRCFLPRSFYASGRRFVIKNR